MSHQVVFSQSTVDPTVIPQRSPETVQKAGATSGAHGAQRTGDVFGLHALRQPAPRRTEPSAEWLGVLTIGNGQGYLYEKYGTSWDGFL